MTEFKTPEIGDAVKIVTENYESTFGLVTAVHGTVRTDIDGHDPWIPSINAVFVSLDESKRDPYGTQMERYSSLQHKSSAKNMPKPGRYWDYAVVADL